MEWNVRLKSFYVNYDLGNASLYLLEGRKDKLCTAKHEKIMSELISFSDMRQQEKYVCVPKQKRSNVLLQKVSTRMCYISVDL